MIMLLSDHDVSSFREYRINVRYAKTLGQTSIHAVNTTDYSWFFVWLFQKGLEVKYKYAL